MKVLIVSFDKTLTEDLKKALSDQDVYVAKNSEEAIKMIPSDVEGVIYDAISGAISEEDINALYTKKFSNARYVILYDELFPVDENNIVVPQKLLVPRDEDPREIAKKLLEFPQEAVAPTEEIEAPPQQPVEEIVQEIGEEIPEIEIEPTSLAASEETLEELSEEVEEALQEVEAYQEEPQEVQEEVKEVAEEKAPAGVKPGKILIVSFDQTLIDSLKATFGQKYEVENVKTVKQAKERGKDAALVVFDAISGVIAEKGLTELAGDEAMSQKAYVILVDDLFPINVDSIPLEKKVSVSRDTDPDRLKEIIEEQLSAVPQVEEEVQVQELPQEEEVEEVQEVEEQPIEELAQELAQNIEEMEVQPQEEVIEEALPQEEEIPALEALGKLIEGEFQEVEEETAVEEEAVEEVPQEAEFEKAEVPAQPQAVSISGEDINRIVESAIAKALSEDRIKEAVSKALEERAFDIRDMVADVVRREVEKVFEELDIRNLIRQATYQALKERLEELIT